MPNHHVCADSAFYDAALSGVQLCGGRSVFERCTFVCLDSEVYNVYDIYNLYIDRGVVVAIIENKRSTCQVTNRFNLYFEGNVTVYMDGDTNRLASYTNLTFDEPSPDITTSSTKYAPQAKLPQANDTAFASLRQARSTCIWKPASLRLWIASGLLRSDG